MNLNERYALKKIIDKALEPYGASAVSWVTGFSQLRIRKYDYPYSSDRSPIFEEFITSEQDWTARKSQIIAELAKLVDKGGAPDSPSRRAYFHFLTVKRRTSRSILYHGNAATTPDRDSAVRSTDYAFPKTAARRE